MSSTSSKNSNRRHLSENSDDPNCNNDKNDHALSSNNVNSNSDDGDLVYSDNKTGYHNHTNSNNDDVSNMNIIKDVDYNVSIFKNENHKSRINVDSDEDMISSNDVNVKIDRDNNSNEILIVSDSVSDYADVMLQDKEECVANHAEDANPENDETMHETDSPGYFELAETKAKPATVNNYPFLMIERMGLSKHVNSKPCDKIVNSRPSERIRKMFRSVEGFPERYNCTICKTVVHEESKKSHLEGHFVLQTKAPVTKIDHSSAKMLEQMGLSRSVIDSERKRSHIKNKYRMEMRKIFKPVDHFPKHVQCQLCDALILKRTMFSHSQRHLGYQIMCEECGKGFSTNFGLHLHQVSTHGKEKHLACKLCDYRTGNNFQLKLHYRSHTGERPYICDLCGKSFYRRLALKGHLLYHTGKRRFKCKKCPKSFFRRGDLKSHMNSLHDRCYMYKCEMCSKFYARVGTVRKHLEAQHAVPREKQGPILKVSTKL